MSRPAPPTRRSSRCRRRSHHTWWTGASLARTSRVAGGPDAGGPAHQSGTQPSKRPGMIGVVSTVVAIGCAVRKPKTIASLSLAYAASAEPASPGFPSTAAGIPARPAAPRLAHGFPPPRRAPPHAGGNARAAGASELRDRLPARRAGPPVERVEAAQQVVPLVVRIPLGDEEIHEGRDAHVHGARRIGPRQDRVGQRGDQRHLRPRQRPAGLDAAVESGVNLRAHRPAVPGREGAQEWGEGDRAKEAEDVASLHGKPPAPKLGRLRGRVQRAGGERLTPAPAGAYVLSRPAVHRPLLTAAPIT